MFLKNFFKPPVFDNEEDTQKAYLLNILLWGLVLTPLPHIIYTQIFEPELAIRAWAQAAIGQTINLFLLFIMRRGYIRLACHIQVISFWLFFTIIALARGGVHSVAYSFGYPLAIIISGFLLGAKHAVGMTGLSLLVGLWMVFQNTTGKITVTETYSASLTWVISAIIFSVIAMLQYVSSRMLSQALERAHRNEEKHKLISKVSTDYTFESSISKDGEVKTIWLAGAFEKMTGYSPKEYLAKGGWYAHVHPDDLSKDANDMEKLLRNEDVVNSEIRTLAKDGSIRWERVFAHPIWDEKENRLTGIVGAVQDVTEQKIAEEKLKETLLQQAAILDNIPDAAWLKDKQGKYIAINEQFCKLFALAPKDIVGKTDADFFPLGLASGYLKGDKEVITSKQRIKFEEKTKDKDGNLIWVETIKTPIFSATGEVVGTTGISREITDRKNAEIEREKLITELENKNTELERFTYTVSHDLKAPLVTIGGFLNYLKQDAKSGNFEKFDKDIARIQHSVTKMETLLKDLLELSRVGRIMNDPTQIKFAEIVREALSLIEGNIRAKNVEIKFVDKGHEVFGDKTRLVEVLQNLIENGIKFMGDQPTPVIQIGSISQTERPIIFFVKDNGIGIDPRFADRIFGLFNKLDINSTGTGIGLTLVKRIIEVHGGKIWFESQPNEGSTFYFTLA